MGELLSVKWIRNSENCDRISLIAKSADRCSRHASDLNAVGAEYLQTVHILGIDEAKFLFIQIDGDTVGYTIPLEERIRILGDRKSHAAADDAHWWIGSLQTSLTNDLAVQFDTIG